MRTLRSSWNCDRVAACANTPKVKIHAPRKRYLYAQYKDNEVSVMTARGKKLITLHFDSKITSAIVKDERLYVETKGDCSFVYDAVTGDMITENRPTPPTGIIYKVAA